MRPAAGPGWRAWTAVAAGALVGTEFRYGLGLLFPEAASALPWTTLSINVSGSFVLAALTTPQDGVLAEGRHRARTAGLFHHIFRRGIFD
jgi:fluoride ion exporter CrcB/FEX